MRAASCWIPLCIEQYAVRRCIFNTHGMCRTRPSEHLKCSATFARLQTTLDL